MRILVCSLLFASTFGLRIYAQENVDNDTPLEQKEESLLLAEADEIVEDSIDQIEEDIEDPQVDVPDEIVEEDVEIAESDDQIEVDVDGDAEQEDEPVEVQDVSDEVITEEDAAPEPVVVEEPKEEIQPIDTIDIAGPSGNWLFKRIWWQHAEGRYEKIRAIFEQLVSLPMTFFERRSNLERSLFDPFYRDIGFDQGELLDIVNYLISLVEKERAREGMLDIQEREFLTLVTSEKKSLEQLKMDVDIVAQRDEEIDTAISMLLEQINRARQFEQMAWQEFKAIAQELSDVRARERFYSIDAQYKNIKSIQDYIMNDFSAYFDKLVLAAKRQVMRVQGEIKGLQERGIDLKAQAKKLLAQDEPSKPVEEPTQDEEPEEEPGMMVRTWHAIQDFFSNLWDLLFGWIYRE